MSAESFLSSVVEVAIGIAGFAGIIAAIRQREVTHWPHVQRILLHMLLTASAGAIVFGLMPALLAEAELPPHTMWRIGSILLIAWFVGTGVFRVRQARREQVSFPYPGAFTAWNGVLVVLQALNLGLAASWPYLVGVFGILSNGFVFFLRLLLEAGGASGGPRGEAAAAEVAERDRVDAR